MIEIYTMNEQGVTLVDTLAYSEWMAWFASSDEQYVVNESAYSKEDLIPVVA